MRILVVDDERAVRESLHRALELEGYEVELAVDGEQALARLLDGADADAVILDVLMPGIDGLEVCRRLRSRGSAVPVLMLTARAEVDSRVAGLDAGADDYLVKPFAFPELLARVRALLRRSRGDQILRLTVADLVLDVTTREASRSGRPLELTAREFELLEYLVRHNGVIVSREMLARDVWHETRRGTPLDNVIDVHIARLRKKVDLDSEAKLIQTVRGVGFIVREGGP
jgi:two-component system copper resistance phosphate regulon response regulator CusR